MNPAIHQAQQFRTTHWSAVLLAAGGATPESEKALEALCRTYWYPLYVFVRSRGHEPAQAEDLTQEFFARLLATEGLASVGPEKGRFRAFLLASLKNFLLNEWDKTQRLKRGQGIQFLHWDQLDAEARYRVEPAGEPGGESAFDRLWAETLVASVLTRLRAEAERDASVARFDVLKAFLVTDAPARYADVGARLGLSEPAVKSAIHRLRRRYAELMRAAVAETIGPEEDVEAEIRYLFTALASGETFAGQSF